MLKKYFNLLTFIYKKINCGDKYKNYNTYIEFNITNDESILKESKSRAEQMQSDVNPHSPSGVVRTPDEILYVNYRGCLAELITKKILTTEIREKGISTIVEDSPGFETDIDGSAQIDLKVINSNTQYNIEIRSSCVRNGTEFGICEKYFNIIGWYKTQTKLSELKKDFYAMVLFPFDECETMTKFENGLTVNFVGGATKAMLQSPLGQYTTLRQSGAQYRGISPICAGLDAKRFIAKILS